MKNLKGATKTANEQSLKQKEKQINRKAKYHKYRFAYECRAVLFVIGA